MAKSPNFLDGIAYGFDHEEKKETIWHEAAQKYSRHFFDLYDYIRGKLNGLEAIFEGEDGGEAWETEKLRSLLARKILERKGGDTTIDISEYTREKIIRELKGHFLLTIADVDPSIEGLLPLLAANLRIAPELEARVQEILEENSDDPEYQAKERKLVDQIDFDTIPRLREQVTVLLDISGRSAGRGGIANNLDEALQDRFPRLRILGPYNKAPGEKGMAGMPLIDGPFDYACIKEAIIVINVVDAMSVIAMQEGLKQIQEYGFKGKVTVVVSIDARDDVRNRGHWGQILNLRSPVRAIQELDHYLRQVVGEAYHGNELKIVIIDAHNEERLRQMFAKPQAPGLEGIPSERIENVIPARELALGALTADLFQISGLEAEAIAHIKTQLKRQKVSKRDMPFAINRLLSEVKAYIDTIITSDNPAQVHQAQRRLTDISGITLDELLTDFNASDYAVVALDEGTADRTALVSQELQHMIEHLAALKRSLSPEGPVTGSIRHGGATTPAADHQAAEVLVGECAKSRDGIGSVGLFGFIKLKVGSDEITVDWPIKVKGKKNGFKDIGLPGMSEAKLLQVLTGQLALEEAVEEIGSQMFRIQEIAGEAKALTHFASEKLAKKHTRSVLEALLKIRGLLEGKTVILPDDMIDTGGSANKAAFVLKRFFGVKKVIIAATHPIFSSPAAAKNLLDEPADNADHAVDAIVHGNTLPKMEHMVKHPSHEERVHAVDISRAVAEKIEGVHKLHSRSTGT